MRALRLHGPRDLRMHNEPIPEPGPGEVLVRVKSVGICASDLHYYREGRIGTSVITQPLVIGHEAAGVVEELGPDASGPSVGDPVAIEPAKPCMRCEWCLSGNYNVCPGIPFFGTPPTDGALREFMTWPASLCLKAPQSLSFDEVAMAEPLAIGLYAANLAGLSGGETVAILGAGAVGLSVLQACMIAGAGKVIVSEPVKERRDLALKLGASEVIDPAASRLAEDVDKITGGRGVDIAFECAGEDDAVRESSRIARVLGKVVVLGIPDGDDYPFDASSSRRKQLTAVFVRRSNQTTEQALELIAEGKMNAGSLATHRFPLERTAEAMEMAISKADGVIRAIVYP